MSADVNDPGARAVDFDQVYDAYREQAIALYDGGVDLFLVETVFDTLNAKAALKAILDLQDEGRTELPIWISGTVDRPLRPDPVRPDDRRVLDLGSPRRAVRGRAQLRVRRGADAAVPGAARGVADTLDLGLPQRRAAERARRVRGGPGGHQLAAARVGAGGLVNIVGGCCGTTPAHIRAIADAVAGIPPRQVPEVRPTLRLSGLEPFAAA